MKINKKMRYSLAKLLEGASDINVKALIRASAWSLEGVAVGLELG